MKIKYGIIPAMAIASLFVSCYAKKPVYTEIPANNEKFKVSYLFEHDGIKVYRFFDDGRYIYFTSPSGMAGALQNDSLETTVYTLPLP